MAAVLLGASGCQATKPGQATATGPAKVGDPPPTHTLARGSLKSKLQLEAVFQAVEMQAFKLEPKAWSDFTVGEVVPHGARVKKGDILVRLDTEKIRDQIEDLEQDRPAAIMALETAQAELESLILTTPQRLEALRRTRRIAEEEYAYFDATGRAQREKNDRFNLKNSAHRLESAQEELKQLEKMYKADDLTEETEEFILKRQRFAFEAAQFNDESTKLSMERDLKVLIPRENETLKAAQRDQELGLALAEETLPRALAKKRLDVERMKRDQKKSDRRLADLKSDLAMMILRAPFDGIVYYGACEYGKWPTAAVLAKKLAPGMKLAPLEILLTVANPDKMVLKGIVPENELAQYKPGLSGQASPVVFPDKKQPVKLEEIGAIPLPTGGFEATFSMPVPSGLGLVPGMNAKLALGEGQGSLVLLAPKEAVFPDGPQKCVYVHQANGPPEKRVVKTGNADDKSIEILEGVTEGEKIRIRKPE